MIKKITWLFGRFAIGLGLSFLIWMIVQQDVKAELPRKVTTEATSTISVDTTTSLSPVATETIPIETTLTPLPLMAPVAYKTTATAITTETTATGTMAASAVNPTPGQPPSIREQALAAAQKYGIPQKIFFALINQESGWDYKSYSSAGAIGLTQVMPFNITAMGYDVETFKNSPAIQLDLGARFLSDQYKTFARWDLALAAYNAGPGAVKKYGGIPPYRETINYVRSILAMAK